MAEIRMHKAAICVKRGQPLVVQERPTPTPGPGQVLLEVKAVALNPADHIQRDMGLSVGTYPCVFGSDIGGTVIAVGEGVKVAPGTRVSAYAQAFVKKGSPDWGAFQERVIVLAELVSPIPDNLSFAEAAMFPMAVRTNWAGLFQLLDFTDPAATIAEIKAKKIPLLLWGAGGSLGSMMIQMASQLGFSIYATASAKHHDYLRSLMSSVSGASLKLFDYNSKTVVDDIVKEVKADNALLQLGYIAAGGIDESVRILKLTKPAGSTAKLSCAPFALKMLLWKVHNWGGVQLEFVVGPKDAEQLKAFHAFVFENWLATALATGTIVVSPQMRVAEGLASIDPLLTELKSGISGTKLVVEL